MRYYSVLQIHVWHTKVWVSTYMHSSLYGQSTIEYHHGWVLAKVVE